MDKETLSNYGWIVICVLVLAVMIALATPFGSFISEAVQSTTKGLFDVNKSALDSTGLINIDNQEFDVPDMNHGAENGGNAIELNPDDGTGVYDGMIYTSGNYEYCYGYVYCTTCNGWSNQCCDCTTCEGWAVRCINDVADPGPILESINNNPITCMYETFSGLTNVTTAPAIPSSVTNISNAFSESLKTYVGSTDPDGDFSGYVIPSSVTEMNYTFSWCESLTTAPVIPSSVTEMVGTFSWCESLTGTITINATPTWYDDCLTDTQITEILGSCGNKSAILATK